MKAYWFETGTPTFLVRKLKAMLSDYRADNPDQVPLLYQTGYLTIIGFDRKKRRYTLGLPNEEGRYGFLESLLSEYNIEFKRDKSAEEALKQIEEQGYNLLYLGDSRTVYQIGVGFDSDSRQLSDWKVEGVHD